MSTSTTDDQLAQQFVLFDLNGADLATATTLLPQLDELPASRPGKAGKRNQAATSKPLQAKAARPTPEPKRLDIAPPALVPELAPLLLDAVRAALFQALYQEALVAYQARLVDAPEASREGTVLAVEPARLGAAAQLLLDTPTLKAAVSLLALGASFQCHDEAEHVIGGPAAVF